MTLLRRLARWLLAIVLAGRGERRPEPERGRQSRELQPPERERRAEAAVLALLAVVVAASIGFALAYAFSDSTQLLGLALGAALTAAAAAAIVASNALVPKEESTEERAEFDNREQQEDVERELLAGGEGITRRRMITAGAGAAGLALGAAVVVPAASLGPAPGEAIGSSPWRRGSVVVDEHGAPLTPEDIALGSFVTGFPAGADRRELGAPIVLVKLLPEDLDLPPERRGWAPKGVLAFSKICTHAGCAINLYRYPLYAPTAPGPALVCPCHYSTFDPATGGERIFGPAGRPLPQLPLALDDSGHLVAAGGFSDDVGPAWSGVRSQ